MHAHNFTADTEDVTETYLGGSYTDAAERIGRLKEMERRGVAQMTVMGSPLYDEVGVPNETSESINHITAYLYSDRPDLFIPCAFALTSDIVAEGFTDTTTSSMIESFLEAGFKGVGELYIHGHDEDVPVDITPGAAQTVPPGLLKICLLAAKYDVPVSVHWEIGTVNDPSVATPEANYAQLKALITGVGKTDALTTDAVLSLNARRVFGV